MKTFSRYRPRILTLALLVVVAALLTLANLSAGPMAGRKVPYGWPLIWHWHTIVIAAPAVFVGGWEYSAPRLVGNLGAWLLIFAALGGICEWLLRRHRPQSRWSLRTMLAAVGLFAAFCAWFSAARQRANAHDEIITLIGNRGAVYFQRCGPRWLDLVGADRFRRRIIGVRVEIYGGAGEDDFKRLKGMLDLRQLRILSIVGLDAWREAADMDRVVSRVMATIADLAQLEELELQGPPEMSDQLGCLAGLKKLRLLMLSIDGDSSGARGGDGGRSSLARLPALPRLEALHLDGFGIGDDDLGSIAVLPRLKSLALNTIHVTDGGLADLAPLQLLEELEIYDTMVSVEGFESLRALKRLRTLHITTTGCYDGELGELALDGGDVLAVYERDAGNLRRALLALRQSNPGIAIDVDRDRRDWFHRHRDSQLHHGVPTYLRRQMTFPFLPQWAGKW